MAVYLEIDISDLQDTINLIERTLTPAKFNRVMYNAFRRTGIHARAIMKKDLPKQYRAKPGDIHRAVGAPHVTTGGPDGVGCTVPISGKRGAIGGTFGATGGKRGWNNVGHPYRVRGKVLRERTGTLPVVMPATGEAPFRNLSASKLNKVAFSRTGKDRLPIRRVMGIAIPQMPMNRSAEDVQADVLDYLAKRIEHEFKVLFSR